MVRAFTLGYPPAYEQAVRIAGNAKAPGGYVFRTAGDAEAYRLSHSEAVTYRPYEIELPGPYDEVTTRDYDRASVARHDWHRKDLAPIIVGSGNRLNDCGICSGLHLVLDHDLLLVEAPFVDPDLGYPRS